jgi:hypothetical protein
MQKVEEQTKKRLFENILECFKGLHPIKVSQIALLKIVKICFKCWFTKTLWLLMRTPLRSDRSCRDDGKSDPKCSEMTYKQRKEMLHFF